MFVNRNKEVCQLFIDFEKPNDHIKRESLYDILIKFSGVPGTLVRVSHKYSYLDDTQSKVRIGNYYSSSFPIEDSLEQGDALSPLLLYFAL